jgi:hypothetical protein
MLTCVASLLNSLPVSLTNELIQEKPEVDWGKLGCLFGDEGSCEHSSLVTVSRAWKKKSDRRSRVPRPGGRVLRDYTVTPLAYGRR